MKKNNTSSIKLLLLCSLNKICYFCISDYSFNSKGIFDFITSSLKNINNKFKNKDVPFIVLDNANTNRSSLIKSFIQKNWAQFIYTTPTTPSQNFAELVFLKIKKIVKNKLLIEN